MPFYNYKKHLFQSINFESINLNLKSYKKLKPYIKMDKKIIKFDGTEIKEYKFH